MDREQAIARPDRRSSNQLPVAGGGPNVSSWPTLAVPFLDLNGSLSRNGNHFPDSGPTLIALQQAELDPQLPFAVSG